ncbi:MAG: hypothetical protein Q9160_005207 [Pyrenula sp. 1 TL-2023]
MQSIYSIDTGYFFDFQNPHPDAAILALEKEIKDEPMEHHILEIDFKDEDPIAMDWILRLFLSPEDGGITTIPDVTEPLGLQMLEIARRLGMPRAANAIIISMKHNLETTVHRSADDPYYETISKWRWYATNLWPKHSNFRLKYLRPLALNGMISHALALMRDKMFMATLGNNKDFRTDLFGEMAKEIELERAYREYLGQ